MTLHQNKRRYRCVECRHGRNLTAYADAVAFGPLADGAELAAHHDVDECGIAEDSIQCTVHHDAEIQRDDGEGWMRWQRCESCKGKGHIPDWRSRYSTVTCPDCRGNSGRWALIREPVGAPC